jgi:hypothetical protein
LAKAWVRSESVPLAKVAWVRSESMPLAKVASVRSESVPLAKVASALRSEAMEKLALTRSARSVARATYH